MATQEGPNPLRPYYIPPSVGLPPSGPPNSTSTASKVRPPSAFSSSARDIFSDIDYKDYISDSTPSAAEVLRNLADQALWKYTSILLAQPFDVAKTLLQVQAGQDGLERGGSVLGGRSAVGRRGAGDEERNEDMRRRPGRYRRGGSVAGGYDVPSSSDSDSDSPSYFTTTAPNAVSPTSSRSRPRHRHPQSRHPRSLHAQSPPLSPSHLSSTSSSSQYRKQHPSPHTAPLPSPSSLLSTISHVWAQEGAWGTWKGTNATFVHNILLNTLTTFIRSFLCAILGIPDPATSASLPPSLIPVQSVMGTSGIDILSAPSPLLSLVAAASAAGLAGCLLAPLDAARTRLMVTISTHKPRSLLATLQSLPSWTISASLTPVTLLYSALPALIAGSTPLFLRARMGVDPVLTPGLYALATFMSQGVELGVKLPLETILRRGQIGWLQPVRPKPTTISQYDSFKAASASKDLETTVPIGAYKGLFGTAYQIVFEEGSRTSSSAVKVVKGSGGAPAVSAQDGRLSVGKKRKGQGLEGLWRGWRVGMWGLVGVWGAAFLGGGGGGGEF
ncbi:mitochondrial fusion and transport protein ugo1 [Agyrium rufum]|nr:mitochondrial fusion and transport protein ugo1 [Agyrium rufum]